MNNDHLIRDIVEVRGDRNTTDSHFKTIVTRIKSISQKINKSHQAKNGIYDPDDIIQRLKNLKEVF